METISKTDNELIAEFMGMSFDEHGQCTDPEQKYSWRPGCYGPLRVEHLQYDTNWNWIMPVVENIEDLEEPVSLNPERGTYWPYEIIRKKKGIEVYNDGQILFGVGGGDIKALHKAVVEFIKWHNQQHP